MKNITIRSARLVAEISPIGAEIQSLRTAEGREYNWQGTPPYWPGRGPVLFPATGAPWDGKYYINGVAFAMPKHGFVKEKAFVAECVAENKAVFTFRPDDESKAAFPFDFVLSVTYTLADDALRADFRVDNPTAAPLHFQIGGHPALAVPGFDALRTVNGYVRLEASDPATPLYLIRAREQGCIQPGRFPVPADGDGLVPLAVSTFANEALIFEAGQVRAIELLDLDKQLVARVESDAPCWLVWQMQGVNSPFVCFEPWYGLPDNEGEPRELAQRPYAQCAPAGGSWHGGFTIRI